MVLRFPVTIPKDQQERDVWELERISAHLWPSLVAYPPDELTEKNIRQACKSILDALELRKDA